MLRKPGFPVANCSIKMPENLTIDGSICEEDNEQQQRRLQLINFGHSQWGFNNWNWTVTKQELDFVDVNNGKYCAGVVAFVSVSVKNLDIHRENIGYATSIATTKGFAIYKSRKCAVTNALRETLLSFGGSVTAELQELLEAHKTETPVQEHENNQNLANKPVEPKNSPNNQPVKKEPIPVPAVKNAPLPTPLPPPVAKAHPMPANVPPAANRAPPRLPAAPAPPPAPPVPPAPPHLRPNSNEVKLEGVSEEEARAERKRRQRQAQEEFRQKQILKQHLDENPEKCTSLDKLLMEIPTQDIVIEETGTIAHESGKRKSPAPDSGPTKRKSSVNKLDIVPAE